MADNVRVRGYSYKANSTTEYRRFSNEYFTGADIRIYFGDIWVDEITNLQFTLQEQVAPIYGYASYTWDKVARGTRFIQGSFSINFTESYYLHSVMNRLSSKMRNASDDTPMFDKNQWKEGVTIEHLMEKSSSGSFDTLADEFEKSLWGQGSMGTQTNQRKDTTFFYPDFPGNGDDDPNQYQLREHGFNILIGYGPMNETDGMKYSETTHSLVGVQLTGCSQVIGGDGQPIQETYNFIAKDLDGNVTKKN
jgi:hypothetical protein